MKKLIAALLLTTAIASPAEARRGGGGYAEKLVFVAPTELTAPDGSALSLCHLVKDHTALMIPIIRSSQGYALAGNGCDTDQYFAFSEAELAEAQKWGMIAADVAATPSIGMARTGMNYAVLGGGGLLVVGGLLAALSGALGGKKKVAGHRVSPKRRDQLLEAVVDVMCHTAMVDGSVDQREITEITRIYQKLTNTPIKQSQIAAQFAQVTGQIDIAGLAAAFQGNEREILLHAAMMVAAADGQIDQAEYDFICDLAHGFGLDGNTIRDILAKLVNDTQGAQTSYGMGHAQPA